MPPAVAAAVVLVIVHKLTLQYSLVHPLVSTPPMLLHAVSVCNQERNCVRCYISRFHQFAKCTAQA
jgi:hypothetical protein